jgi:LacI family transcriptional regulator
VADITNPFFAALVRGVEQGLSDLRYDLLVSNTDERPEREDAALRMLAARRADGIVIAPTGAPQDFGADLDRLRIPIVSIDRRSASLRGPVVTIDNAAISERATRHLLELGHRRLAILTRADALSTVAERVAGFERAVAEFPDAVGRACAADGTIAAAFAVTRALLDGAGHVRPTAIVAGNHTMALGVLHALHDGAWSCPADVSVVAFDDHPWAPIFTPPLTVIRIPVAAMCRAACDVLRTMMLGDPTQSPRVGTSDVVLPAELVLRGSTAPPGLRR